MLHWQCNDDGAKEKRKHPVSWIWLSCAQAVPGSATGADSVCNEALPNNTVYARFLYVIRFLTANGFYVLIDNHLSFDSTAATNPAQCALEPYATLQVLMTR